MHKYLILLPNNLGDVITSVPILEGLKKKDESCNISFLVENGFEAGVENNPYCDRLIRFDRKKIRNCIQYEWQSGIGYLEKFIENLKQESIDTIINLSQNTYISYLVTLIKAKEIRGMKFLPEGNFAVNDKWSQYLYAVPYARKFNCLHVTDIYKRIAGVQNTETKSRIILKKNEIETAEKFIKDLSIDSSLKKIVFQCGAATRVKRWPTEHFVNLGKKLTKEGYFILITGASQEFESAKKIQEGIGENCAVSAGKLSFRETIALLLFVECCIISDTALMHAAAALKRRVIALFGPTNPVETGPYGSDNVVLAGKCPERPCFNNNCKSNKCMKGIIPDIVYSCIHNQYPKNSSCDIFKTELSDGVYKLVPADKKAKKYYDETGAAVTRKFMESWISVPENDDFKEIARSTILYSEEIKKMEKELVEFLSDKDISHMHKYEKIHGELMESRDINGFWNAIMNLRLNSIPVLEPINGVKESINILAKTSVQIKKTVENDMQTL